MLWCFDPEKKGKVPKSTTFLVKGKRDLSKSLYKNRPL